MPRSLPELRAAEAEVAREWRWLHDALNEIARVRAEQGDAQPFGSCRRRPCAWASDASSSQCASRNWNGSAEPEVAASATQNGALPSGGSPRPGVRGGFR